MSAQTMLETLVAASRNPVAALALKATLAMLAALVLIRAARGQSASLRHLLAASSFGVLLLLPLAVAFVPERPIAVAPVTAAARPMDVTIKVATTAPARVNPAPAAARSSPRVRPVMVRASRCSSGRSSRNTAVSPPAR